MVEGKLAVGTASVLQYVTPGRRLREDNAFAAAQWDRLVVPGRTGRRGDASACVAALSAELLQAGRRYCCRYADLANRTSNSIYQRINYRAPADVEDWRVGSLTWLPTPQLPVSATTAHPRLASCPARLGPGTGAAHTATKYRPGSNQGRHQEVAWVGEAVTPTYVLDAARMPPEASVTGAGSRPACRTPW